MRRAPGGGLLHPAALLSIAVLLANDHWGKRAFPGALTGKLSDVAGLVFFPLLLQALVELASARLGRYRGPSLKLLVGCAFATALVFTLVKTWGPAGALYRHGLAALQWPFRALVSLAGGRGVPTIRPVSLVQDAGDLFALPAVLVSVWSGRARTRPPRN